MVTKRSRNEWSASRRGPGAWIAIALLAVVVAVVISQVDFYDDSSGKLSFWFAVGIAAICVIQSVRSSRLRRNPPTS